MPSVAATGTLFHTLRNTPPHLREKNEEEEINLLLMRTKLVTNTPNIDLTFQWYDSKKNDDKKNMSKSTGKQLVNSNMY